MSKVSAVFSAITDFFVSTAFKHRVTAVAIPVALEAINLTQEQFSGVQPSTPEVALTLTVVYAVLGWLRGKVSPA